MRAAFHSIATLRSTAAIIALATIPRSFVVAARHRSASFVPTHFSLTQRQFYHRRTPLAFSTMGFQQPGKRGDGDDSRSQDESRWERMWEDGELGRNIEKALDTSAPSYTPPSSASSVVRSEVRVITFDLDNTLWRTSEVISHANNVLAEYLAERGIATPVRTEAVMGELFKNNMAKYCPLESFDETGNVFHKNKPNGSPAATDFDKAAGGVAAAGSVNGSGAKGVHISSGQARPVLLTQLRVDAVQYILIKYNSYSDEDAAKTAWEAFEIWTQARHDAIPNHYATGVLEQLDNLRQITSKTGQKVVMGAITDGNSDPTRIEQLRPYFDFVINSESVGVAKPDPRVYLAAAEILLADERLEDIFMNTMGACKLLDDAVEKTDLLQEAIGPWWIHVGDDFMKDIVASKDLGARTVWCRELVKKPVSSDEEKNDAIRQLNGAKKERNVADLVSELASMKVVEMSIGADEFLANCIHREFADSILDDFGILSELLHNWHRDGSKLR